MFGEHVRDEGVGVAVAHSVLLLQPGDQLHSLAGGRARISAFHSAIGRPYFFSIEGK